MSGSEYSGMTSSTVPLPVYLGTSLLEAALSRRTLPSATSRAMPWGKVPR